MTCADILLRIIISFSFVYKPVSGACRNWAIESFDSASRRVQHKMPFCLHPHAPQRTLWVSLLYLILWSETGRNVVKVFARAKNRTRDPGSKATIHWAIALPQSVRSISVCVRVRTCIDSLRSHLVSDCHKNSGRNKAGHESNNLPRTPAPWKQTIISTNLRPPSY